MIFKYPKLIRNDLEKQEFIKSRIKQGLHASQIKKDFDRKYGQYAPSLATVIIWAARFKTAARGNAYDHNSKQSKKINEKYRKFIENGVHQRKSEAVKSTKNKVKKWSHRLKDRSKFFLYLYFHYYKF